MTLKKVKRRTKIIVLIIVYGSFVIGTLQLAALGNFNFQRWQRPSMNQVAARIANCGAGAEIVASEPYAAIELSYYLPTCHIHFVSPDQTLDGGYAPLNDSNLQIKSLSAPMAQHLIYIHYTDSPALPVGYRVTQTQQFAAGSIALTDLARLH